MRNNKLDKVKMRVAINNYDIDTVKELLTNGFNPNEYGDYRKSAILLAANNCFLDAIKLMVEHGGNINDTQDVNILTEVYEKEHPPEKRHEVIKYLLEQGIKISLKNDMYDSPMHIAISRGDLVGLQLITNAHPQIIKNSKNRMKLFDLTTSDDLAPEMMEYVTKYLKEKELNRCFLSSLRSPKAAYVSKEILKMGAKINVREEDVGYYPGDIFELSTRCKNYEMLDVAIKAEKDGVQFDQEQRYPACKNLIHDNNYDLFFKLLETVNTESLKGKILDMAISETVSKTSKDFDTIDKKINTIESLVAEKLKFDPSYQMEKSLVVLSMLKANRSYSRDAKFDSIDTGTIDYFINKGFDVNTQDKDGDTIMHIIANSNYKNVNEMLQYVISNYDPDMSILNNSKRDPLMVACESDYEISQRSVENEIRNERKVSIIISSSSADIDTIDRYGKTALMSAMSGLKFKVVKTLLEAGADINRQNQDGKTIYDYYYGGKGNDIYPEFLKILDYYFLKQNPKIKAKSKNDHDQGR